MVKITVSVGFDNQGQSFATHHNQMHVQFGLIIEEAVLRKDSV